MLLNEDFKNIDINKFYDKKVDLFIADPPYGKIIKDKYDQIENLAPLLLDTAKWMAKYSYQGTSAYMFGGTGKYQYRPFLEFAINVENSTKWRIVNWITWAKRKGYGTQKNWMYAREEILFMVHDAQYPKYFNVPYRDEERSKAWKKRLSRQEKYQPKTSQFRYSNVISDINELFRNKYVTTEKPEKLYKLLIKTSCPPNGLIVDPMCGSGTTAAVIEKEFKDMNYICIEKNKNTYQIAKKRLLK